MKQMRLSLPEDLDSFVETEAAARGFSTRDAYVLDLIGREQQRQALRAKLQEGLASPTIAVADADYFAKLMARASDGLEDR
jgi:antitoxin ParD1/3/4